MYIESFPCKVNSAGNIKFNPRMSFGCGFPSYKRVRRNGNAENTKIAEKIRLPFQVRYIKDIEVKILDLSGRNSATRAIGFTA